MDVYNQEIQDSSNKAIEKKNFYLLRREKCKVIYQISTHHKPLGVLLYMFVCGNGNGHRLLVTVVIVGLDILSSFQPISLLSWNRQHSQNQLLLPSTDQVHHLLMGGTLHTHAITGEKVRWRERQIESQQFEKKNNPLFPLFFTGSIYASGDSTFYTQKRTDQAFSTDQSRA